MRYRIPLYEWVFFVAAGIVFIFAWTTAYGQNNLSIIATDIPGSCLDSAMNVYGNESASWRVVEFMDYDCAPCRNLEAVANQICHATDGRLRWQVVMFPLPMHKNAKLLADVATVAYQRSNLVVVHQSLASSWKDPLNKRISAVAAKLGLPTDKLVKLARQEADYSVRKQMFLGDCLGINGTPTVFLVSPDQRVWAVSDVAQIPAFIADMPSGQNTISESRPRVRRHLNALSFEPN